MSDVIVCEECGTVCESCAGNRAEMRRLRALLRWVLREGQQPWVAAKIEDALGRKKRSDHHRAGISWWASSAVREMKAKR